MPARLLICAIVLLACVRAIGADAGASVAAPALAKAWRNIERRPLSLGVREVFSFALEAAAVGTRADQVEAALRLAAEMQDRDAASRTRGNFRWYLGQPKPVDLNAVEFCMQQAVLLWNLPRSALTPPARPLLETLLRESVRGIRSHRVDVSYTNIFLMKTWNCVALGEALDDAALTALGTQMLDEWFAYTKANGIHEFLSPTYSGVDVDSLALLHRFARAPDVQRKAGVALRLIHAQSAANWFAPAERLGGAHSRDYDYLTGHGVFDAHLADWGWRRRDAPAGSAFAGFTRWVPETPLAPLPVPRFVWQRWGDSPGAYAATYVGRGFCLGSAGAAYNTDDKVFTLQFPGTADTVMGNLVVDGRGDPYGHSKEPDGNGHPKALHLLPFVASVQDGVDVLLAASFDPRQKINRRAPAATRLLATHLVLPAEAEVWSGGNRLSPPEGGSVAVVDDAPVFVRVRDVVLAVRVLAATDCTGRPVTARYIRDGTSLHAARLTWSQSPGPAAGEAHVVLWAQAAEGLDDASFAVMRQQYKEIPAKAEVLEGKLDASVTRPDRAPLLLHADLATGERRVSPSPAGDAIITVNGRSLLEIAGIEWP